MGHYLSFSADPATIRASGHGNLRLVSINEADDLVRVARLAGDRAGERRARYGTALCDQYFYLYPSGPGSWKDSLSSSLISSIAGATGNIVVPPPGDISPGDAKMLAALIFNFLRTAPPVVMQSRSFLSINRAGDDDPAEVEDHGVEALLQLLFALPAVFQFDQRPGSSGGHRSV